MKALCHEFDDLRPDYNKFFKKGWDAHAGRCSEWYRDSKICSWHSLASCCEYVGGKQTREKVLPKVYEESIGRFFDAHLLLVEMEEIKQRKQRKSWNCILWHNHRNYSKSIANNKPSSLSHTPFQQKILHVVKTSSTIT